MCREKRHLDIPPSTQPPDSVTSSSTHPLLDAADLELIYPQQNPSPQTLFKSTENASVDHSGINLFHLQDLTATSLILLAQLYDTREGTSFRTSLCKTVDWLTLV